MWRLPPSLNSCALDGIKIPGTYKSRNVSKHKIVLILMKMVMLYKLTIKIKKINSNIDNTLKN